MYFLNEVTDNPNIAAREAPGGVSSFMEGVGAAVEKSWIEGDWNFRTKTDYRDVQFDAFNHLAEIMGDEALLEAMGRSGSGWTVDRLRAFVYNDPNTRDEVMAVVQQNYAENPEAWAGFAVTEEQVDAAVTERQRAEYQDALDTLSMMPGGGGAAQFVGEIIGSTANLESAPFLFLGGGGGSFLKVMGREAAINTAIEGAVMPFQFRQAERLDIADPNVAQQLSYAAIGGAVFGGGFEALGRGVNYYRGRNTLDMHFNPTAESVYITGHLEDVAARNTLDLAAEIQRIADTGVQLQRANAPLVTPRPDPPVNPIDAPIEETILPPAEEARQAESASQTGPRRPFTHALKSVGVRPDSPLGEELRNMGFTSRNTPGLFNRNGISDIDNLPADEWGEMANLTGVDGYYLDRQGALDRLDAELRGDDARAAGHTYVPDYRAAQDEFLERAKAPLDEDYIAPPSNLDDFVSADPYVRTRSVMERIDQHIQDNGYDGVLTPSERRELIETLDQHGGHIEDAIAVLLEREADSFYAKMQKGSDDGIAEEIPGWSDAETGGSVGDVRQGGGEQAPQRGGAENRAADDGLAGEAVSERTDAGDQFVTPGVRPITTSERLAALQNGPMRGGNAPADMGLFDLNARTQRDMFEGGIDSPEVKAAMDERAADLRADIEANGDSRIDLGDGKGERAISDVLEELDDDQGFIEVMNMCGRE